MSKKILAVLSVLLCFSLIFYGCKSKPETEDENPVEEVAPGQMTEEEILKAAQETARKAEEAIGRAMKPNFTLKPFPERSRLLLKEYFPASTKSSYIRFSR